jgi:hypothetical protein
MVNIDDETNFGNNQIDFWDCECTENPLFMYNVDGEFRETLTSFWRNYNSFPLKVVHNFVREIDDLDSDEKVYKLRIDTVNTIGELDNMLDEIGWKLTEEHFFITNSSKEMVFKSTEIDILNGKVFAQKPIFELDTGETLTEVILHGYSFLIGTNDTNLSTKELVKDISLR